MRSILARTRDACCSLSVTICFVLIISTGCGSSALAAPPAQASSSVASLAESPATPTVLLFNGTGTTSSDVAAVESVLNTLKLTYATATSSQMNAMTETQLKAYKLLIVPGGDSITIGDNLTTGTTTNIRNAVTKDGLHYLGICAGAFFGGYSIYNGLDLTSGVWFNLYANGGKGTGKTVVTLSFPNNTTMDMYWQDGPQLSGWGSTVSEYPDGTPAMTEGHSGNGWVVLSGVHPEAPASWRLGMNFKTSLAADLAYAGTLVTSALNGTSLPHY